MVTMHEHRYRSWLTSATDDEVRAEAGALADLLVRELPDPAGDRAWRLGLAREELDRRGLPEPQALSAPPV